MNDVENASPYLRVNDATAAIAFYVEVFGAQEKVRLAEPSGLIGHAELSLGPLTLMLSDEFPDFGVLGPPTEGGTGASIKLFVTDADEMAYRAVAAGAAMLHEPADQFYGLRECTIRDPFGHHWIIAHRIENVTDEDIQRRLAKKE